MRNMLQGAYDIHVHTSPDIVERKCDDIELGRRLTEAGMAGCVIKGHFTETAGRARVLQKLYPDLTVRGGIVLNHFCGGLNPAAVEYCGKMGGRFVWMPTLDAWSFRHLAGNAEESGGIKLLDDCGNLVPAVYDVLDAAAQYKMIVATGHVSAAEGLAVVREAERRHLRTILTHADYNHDRYSMEEQREAVYHGAIVEHSYYTIYHRLSEEEEMVREIREIGYKNVVLSTDFGQTNSGYPDEGILAYAELLLAHGFAESEVRHMIAVLPERLLRNTI